MLGCWVVSVTKMAQVDLESGRVGVVHARYPPPMLSPLANTRVAASEGSHSSTFWLNVNSFRGLRWVA
jgi:hypothetical protein